MEHITRTVCQACHCQCGVLVTSEGGRVKSVKGDPDHPLNRGFTCVKGRAQPGFIHHPDRLRYPLKRKGEHGAGMWERVSWDEALDGIAAQLTKVRDTFGALSIAAIHGTGPRASLASTLVPYMLGSPNRISVDLHICLAPSLAAEFATFGPQKRQASARETGCGLRP